MAVNRYSILKELVKKYKARILYVVFRRYVLLHKKKTELVLGYKIKVAGRKYQFNSRWVLFVFTPTITMFLTDVSYVLSSI